MKKLLTACLLLAMIACVPKDRFVRTANKVIPQTAMLEVRAIVEMAEFTFDGEHLSVKTSTAAATFYGSAVFISPHGHLLTCAHMFEQGTVSTVTVVTADGVSQIAEVLYQDHRRDLALIKVDRETPDYAELVDPRSVEVGQEVIAVGNPLGFDFTVTQGIISALSRDSVGLYDALQTDTFINPGNSGGPLFNLAGRLVGINSRIVSPSQDPVFSGLAFSVSPGQILEFLTKFRGIDNSYEKVEYDRAD